MLKGAYCTGAVPTEPQGPFSETSWIVRSGRIWLVVAIGFFAGFWVLRGLFGGPDASPSVSREEQGQPLPEAEEIEAPEVMVELVEPPSVAGTIFPTGLLRRMYPLLWSAEGFCWEESEAGYDADSPRIDTGLVHGADPPADLLEFLAGRGESYDDYGYKWFNSRQLLFMHQEMSVTDGGRSGPRAGATRVVRREAPDGRQFWEVFDGAAVYPCD